MSESGAYFPQPKEPFNEVKRQNSKVRSYFMNGASILLVPVSKFKHWSTSETLALSIVSVILSLTLDLIALIQKEILNQVQKDCLSFTQPTFAFSLLRFHSKK